MKHKQTKEFELFSCDLISISRVSNSGRVQTLRLEEFMAMDSRREKRGGAGTGTAPGSAWVDPPGPPGTGWGVWAPTPAPCCPGRR